MKPAGRWDFMIRRAARMSDLELARALAARERSCAWHWTDGEWLMLDQERGNRPSMTRSHAGQPAPSSQPAGLPAADGCDADWNGAPGENDPID